MRLIQELADLTDSLTWGKYRNPYLTLKLAWQSLGVSLFKRGRGHGHSLIYLMNFESSAKRHFRLNFHQIWIVFQVFTQAFGPNNERSIGLTTISLVCENPVC